MHHIPVDTLAYRASPIHGLDARCKLLATLLFTGTVLALPGREIGPVFYFGLGPFVMLTLGAIPLTLVLKQILVASPFVLLLGLACPYYDRMPLTVHFGPFTWPATEGWVRCGAILAKYCVSMSALVSLVSTTRFPDLLVGLRRLRVPGALVTQVGLLYRSLFLLTGQVQRMKRAHDARRVGHLNIFTKMRIALALLGSLLFDSLERAGRVSVAMQARGFTGQWHAGSTRPLDARDGLFMASALGFTFGLLLLLRHGWL